MASLDDGFFSYRDNNGRKAHISDLKEHETFQGLCREISQSVLDYKTKVVDNAMP